MTSKKPARPTKPHVSFRLPQKEMDVAQQLSLNEEGALEVSAKQMDKVVLFKGSCARNGIKISDSSPSISLTPPGSPYKPFRGTASSTHRRAKSSLSGLRSARSLPLTVFPTFQYLPSHVRKKIWRFAAIGIPGHAIPIQPNATGHPALSSVNHEARNVFLEEYALLHSRQAGRMSDFSLSINYDKDLLYINRRFVRNPRIFVVTPLTESIVVYRDWLKPVKQLALNLKDTQFLLPRAWGLNPPPYPRVDELWDVLGVHCPELRLLWFVDDEAAELGMDGYLANSRVFQPNRSFEWNVRWSRFRMSLEVAKVRQVVRQDLVLKPMNASMVVPEELAV